MGYEESDETCEIPQETASLFIRSPQATNEFDAETIKLVYLADQSVSAGSRSLSSFTKVGFQR